MGRGGHCQNGNLVVLIEHGGEPVLQDAPRHDVQTKRVVADGFIERDAALLLGLQLGQPEFHKFRQHRHSEGDCAAVEQFLFQRAVVKHPGFGRPRRDADDDVIHLPAAELADGSEVGHHV